MEKCTWEGCGKEFETEAKLRGHMMSHTRKKADASSDTATARARSDAPNETLEEKIARLRAERVPISVPDKKWSCPENDGYHYRVFNDEWMAKPGNIQAAIKAGYEFVESDNEKERPKVVGTNENGSAIKGYLMRIPKVLYDEDQAAKQKEIDRVDAQIKNGNFQQGADDRRYVPKTGIKIESNNQPPAT